MWYCTSWNFRGGFSFANFASQTLAKISTSIYVYLSKDNMCEIYPSGITASKTAKNNWCKNNGVYSRWLDENENVNTVEPC